MSLKKSIQQKISQPKLIIQSSILLFWSLFWGLNFLDKIFDRSATYWHGKDRLPQFEAYLQLINLNHPLLSKSLLALITLLEFATAILFISTAWHYLHQTKKVKHYFSLAVGGGLLTLTLFTVGDQVFGDRVELLEHSTYWGILLLSYYIFTTLSSKNKK